MTINFPKEGGNHLSTGGRGERKKGVVKEEKLKQFGRAEDGKGGEEVWRWSIGGREEFKPKSSCLFSLSLFFLSSRRGLVKSKKKRFKM